MQSFNHQATSSRTQPDSSLFNCSICGYKFMTDGNRHRVPLTLSCCHAACLKCVQEKAKKNHELICRKCKTISPAPISVTESVLYKHFPPNLYLLGVLSCSRTISAVSEPDFKFVSKSKSKDSEGEKKSVTCNECDTNDAELNCPRCPAVYCAGCFQKTHSAVKALKDHEAKPLVSIIANGDDDGLSTKCDTHAQFNLEFHCSDCDAVICSQCLIAEHNGHSMKSLVEKNKELSDSLTDSFLSLTNLMTRLNASLQNALAESTNSNTSETMTQAERVRNHFFLLHSKLSLIETAVLNQLKDSHGADPSLDGVIEELKSSIGVVQAGLVKAKSVIIQRQYQNVNYVKLLSYLEQLQNRPSFMIKEESDKKEVELNIDDSIFGQLEVHCAVRVNDKKKYRLCVESELPENYTPEVVPVWTKEDLAAATFNSDQQCSTQPSSDCDRSNDDDSSSQKSSSSMSSFGFRDVIINSIEDDLVPGVTVEGTLTHVVSPSEFYFHRSSSKDMLINLNGCIKYFISRRRLKSISQRELSIGGIYLYNHDNSWNRCKVIRKNKGIVRIFYLDFGITEDVSGDKFITTVEIIRDVPPLALRCKLSDCLPIDGFKWTPDAVNTMVEILVLSAHVQLHVVKKKDLCYEVEILVPSENNHFNCVRDTLIFLGHASHVSNPKRIEIPLPKPKQLPRQAIITDPQPCDVVLLSVLSPDELYVEHLSPANDLCKAMLEDMTKNYTINRNSNVPCYDPRPGMMTVVWCPREKKWHRTLIVDRTDKSKIDVFFVDRGQYACFSWEKLYMLEARFYNYPALAYKYKLADVAPIFGQTWSSRATGYLGKYIGKTLSLTRVTDDCNGSVDSTSQVIGNNGSVQLIYSTEFSKTCLNADLALECEDVVSTGKLSRTVDLHRDVSALDPNALNEINLPDDCAQSVSSENIEMADVVPALSKRTGVDENEAGGSAAFVDFSSSEQFPPLSLKTNDEEDDHVIICKDGSLRIKVEMKKIVSPSEFYIIILKEKKKILLQDRSLNRHYRGSEPDESIDWSDRLYCVANYDGKWYRATINDFNEEDRTVSVYLPDEASTVTVPITNLRKLDHSFSLMRDGAIRCSLAGLLPQSGPNYALTATTELEEFVEKFKTNLYIANLQKTDNSDKVLRVELLGRKRITPGPFDAASDKWTSLNYKLWKDGFARAESSVRWNAQETIFYVAQCNAPKTEEETLIEHMARSFKKTADGKIDISAPLRSGPNANKMPTSWPPPEPLPKLVFVGKASFLSDDLVVYLHDESSSRLYLDRISQLLTEYCNSPNSLDYESFSENDICAARYHLDNKWYRAVIQKIDEVNHIFHVQFVDYGNIEFIERDEIRRVNTICQNIPIQVHRCYFENLRPIGRTWNLEDIKELHALIVDFKCNLEVGILPDGRYEIKKMILPNGINVEQEIISRRWGCSAEHAALMANNKQDGEKADTDIDDSAESELEAVVKTEILVPKSSDHGVVLWTRILERQGSPRVLFEVVPIPEEVDTLFVEITVVISPTIVIAKLLESDHSDLIDNIRLFKTMQSNLQKASAKFPIAKPPYFLKECCCRYSDDQQWYRAIVISDEDSSGRVLIQYVDYGNVERVHKREIRELTEKMRLICAQGIPCELNGITYAKKNVGPEDVAILDEHLSQKRLKATIKKRDTLISIELSDPDGGSLYEPLVAKGFLKG